MIAYLADSRCWLAAIFLLSAWLALPSAARAQTPAATGAKNDRDTGLSPAPPGVRKISAHPQLFLDDLLIAARDNLSRVVEQPRKHPANPVIRQDRPWEKRLIEVYGTVLYDPATARFRCWYLANENRDGIPDSPDHPRTVEYYQCYAESTDGVRWTKPHVGRAPFGRHAAHNIVIPGGHGFCVLETPDDPRPERRFKGAGGDLFGCSPDGLHWSLNSWREAIGKNDTGTSIVRWQNRYLAYVRYQIRDPNWPAVMRGVGVSCSEDFETWSPKELVLQTDSLDGYPWTQPYGLSVTAYGDQLIGLLWMLHLDRREGNNSLGDMDVQLVVSRDGRSWQRVAERQPLLQPTPESWDRGRVFPSTTLLTRDDLVHIYYTGTPSRHGEPWGEPAIGLATLPADRFVGLRPTVAHQPGRLQTPPVQASGTRLIVNAEVAPGQLQVELLDRRGNVLDGYSTSDSRIVPQDALRHRVYWTNGTQQRQFGDRPEQQPVAVRFTLHGGTLFAFQVSP